MRVENHTHIRHIMLYHFEKGWTGAQSFRDLNELFGEGTISKSQCMEWFARFKNGDTSLKDKPGRGRPSDFDDQALLAAVEEDESLTTRMLAEDFNVDHSTIVRRLKKLEKYESSERAKKAQEARDAKKNKKAGRAANMITARKRSISGLTESTSSTSAEAESTTDRPPATKLDVGTQTEPIRGKKRKEQLEEAQSYDEDELNML